MFRFALVLSLLGAMIMTAEADDKKKDPLPKPWEETVTVRNKKGNSVLPPVDAYAYRKDVKGETVLYVKRGDAKNKGYQDDIFPDSEITAEDGTVYVVTKAKQFIDWDHQRCWVKKKDPQPKKDK